jgi:hypothetical protein
VNAIAARSPKQEMRQASMALARLVYRAGRTSKR